jgi:hypothetical protein
MKNVLKVRVDAHKLIINYVQYVPGGKVNIRDHIISHSKKKKYMNMCPIPNGFRDRAI